MQKITKEYVRTFFPAREKESHKGTFGMLLNISGSIGMAGAALLSTMGALRSGAGLVTLASPMSVITPICSSIMEATTIPLEETITGTISSNAVTSLCERLSKYTAVLIGCGLGVTADTITIVSEIIKNATIPIVLDADGINALAQRIDIIQTAKAPLILTPHPGEMGRLLGISSQEVNARRADTAKSFANEYGVILVLKGAGTIVAAPGQEVFFNTTGNPGMARGGSGDVLAGMIASFAAQGIPPAASAHCGVYLHGLAGDLAAEELTEYAMLPRDIIDRIPQAFTRLSS